MKMREVSGSIKKKIEDLDERQIYYVFGAILLTLFLLDYFILMRPQLKALSKISPEIKILRNDYKTAKENITKQNYFQTEVKKLTEDIASAKEKIKTKFEVPLILERISSLADKNDLRIDQIMPLSSGQEEILSTNEAVYSLLPIDIKAKGGYHDFGKFIRAIETANVFLKVKSFKLKSGTKKANHDIELVLQAVISEEK